MSSQEDNVRALDVIERQLSEKTERIEDLRQRTRVLEIEVAAWKPPPARIRRESRLASVFAFSLGLFASASVIKLIAVFVSFVR